MSYLLIFLLALFLEEKLLKNFILIWFGELISGIGSGMTSFALSVYIYQTTGSVSLISLVTVASFLPTILLSPFGGILADRYDRRLLMIIGDFFSGLGLAYVLWNIHFGHPNILPILLGVTFNAIFVALMEPAFKATVTDLLTKDEYAKASGMVQIAGNARYLISPALAGMLLAKADIQIILLLDICTFFITITTVSFARKSIERPIFTKRQSVWMEMKEGLAVLKGSKGILYLIMLMAAVCFFVGFLQTLVSPMILAISNAQTVGILESVCATGMLVGSIVIGFLGIKKSYVKVLSLASVMASLCMILSGVSVSLLITGTGIFLFFFVLPFINTSADVLVRSNVKGEVQGRVWGLISLLSQIGTVLAYLLSGPLADYIFEPLLAKSGPLATSIGVLIGTGPGRGIGLMFILSGLLMLPVSFAIGQNRSIQALQKNIE